MTKLLISLVLALFVTVGVATPILSGFLPGSDGVAVYAGGNGDQGEDDDDQGEDEQ